MNISNNATFLAKTDIVSYTDNIKNYSINSPDYKISITLDVDVSN